MTSPRDWFHIQNAVAVASPAVLIHEERVRQNIQRMVSMVGEVTRLRPHVKTHKLPQVIKLKLAAGISKFKAATLAEAEMTAAAGGRDVLLAYQLVGPNIRRFVELSKAFPACRFAAVVDNEVSLQQMAQAAHQHGLKIPLFVDLNVGMHRTGIPVGETARRLYQTLCQTPALTAAGFHAYDGHLHEPDSMELKRLCEAAFEPVWQLRRQLEQQGFPVPTIVAGGTPTSHLLAQQAGVEVSWGTTVLWDSGQPELSPHLEFLPAAVLLTRVISVPGPTRICVDLGHKAVASEMPQPRVHWLSEGNFKPVMHSEEHLVLEVDDANRFPVGTVLYGVPRHVCPTIALHQEVVCVRDAMACETWPVVARARRILF